MNSLPLYIPLTFVSTTIAALLFIVWALKNSASLQTRKKSLLVFIILAGWLILQGFLSLKNIYNSDTSVFPPKIMLLGILPAVFTILVLFSFKSGQIFIDSLPLKTLTYLHVVRIPVELVLFWLFVHKAVPQLMTFEGRNFDILAGITAPVIAWLGFSKSKPNNQVILIWNFVCIGLLINIIVNALLSTPSPVQQFAFDQPNIAVLNFPFSWLPCLVVPLVLFAHLASIRQLIKQKREAKQNTKSGKLQATA